MKRGVSLAVLSAILIFSIVSVSAFWPFDSLIGKKTITGEVVSSYGGGAYGYGTTCTDSDANNAYPIGNNYNLKGYVSQNNINKWDECIDANILKEYLCYPNKQDNYYIPFYCQYGCSNGACLNTSAGTGYGYGYDSSVSASGIKCADSDGGKSIYVKGFVKDKYTTSFQNGVIYDSCAVKNSQGNYEFVSSCNTGNNSCYIAEYYCATADNHNIVFQNCTNGCKDGACISGVNSGYGHDVPRSSSEGSGGVENSYHKAYWRCYNGEESYEGGDSSCKPSSLWQEYAKSFCNNKCSSETGKCGVDSFSVSNVCDGDMTIPKYIIAHDFGAIKYVGSEAGGDAKIVNELKNKFSNFVDGASALYNYIISSSSGGGGGGSSGGTETSYHKAYWKCYNGEESYGGGESSCKPYSLWKEYAATYCKNKCSSGYGKCGVDSFSVSNPCNPDGSSSGGSGGGALIDCRDSDVKNNPYAQGYLRDQYSASFPNGLIPDTCEVKDASGNGVTNSVNSCSGDNCYVRDYYCVGNSNGNSNHNSYSYPCSNGCRNGACIINSWGSESLYCNDSDNGLNYFVRGFVYSNVGSQAPNRGYDGCLDDNYQSNEVVLSDGAVIKPGTGTKISEVYCDDNKMFASKIVDCEFGCFGGACILSSTSSSGSVTGNPIVEYEMPAQVNPTVSVQTTSTNVNTASGDIIVGVAEFGQEITFNEFNQQIVKSLKDRGGNVSLSWVTANPDGLPETNSLTDAKILVAEDDKGTASIIWISRNYIVASVVENFNAVDGESLKDLIIAYLKKYPSTLIVDENIAACNGCYLDEKCYPIGYRVSESYCSADGGFVSQSSSDGQCNNNFECASNVCASGKCIDAGLLTKVINWFKGIFGFGG